MLSTLRALSHLQQTCGGGTIIIPILQMYQELRHKEVVQDAVQAPGSLIQVRSSAGSGEFE